MMKSKYFFDNNQTDARLTYCEKYANTIRARYGTGGGNTPIIVEVSHVGQARTLSKVEIYGQSDNTASLRL